MGAVRITSLNPKFNRSHFGLPPSGIHRMTGWVANSRILWRMRTAPITNTPVTVILSLMYGFHFSLPSFTCHLTSIGDCQPHACSCQRCTSTFWRRARLEISMFLHSVEAVWLGLGQGIFGKVRVREKSAFDDLIIYPAFTSENDTVKGFRCWAGFNQKEFRKATFSKYTIASAVLAIGGIFFFISRNNATRYTPSLIWISKANSTLKDVFISSGLWSIAKQRGKRCAKVS